MSTISGIKYPCPKCNGSGIDREATERMYKRESSSTGHIRCFFCHGNGTDNAAYFRWSTPNKVKFGGTMYNPDRSFYVSFNDTDISIYGDETTALVLGEMEKFYILNGDHRKQYQPLMEIGFKECLEYFVANRNLKNKMSEDV